MRRPTSSEGLRARPPATQDDLEESVRALGFRLPAVVADFYCSVANGGQGFLGIANGVVDDRGNNAVTLYGEFMSYVDDQPDPEFDVVWTWTSGVLPIYYWGCNAYSCVGEDGRMIGRDGYFWAPDGQPFETWLADWAQGSLRQPATDGSGKPPE